MKVLFYSDPRIPWLKPNYVQSVDEGCHLTSGIVRVVGGVNDGLGRFFLPTQMSGAEKTGNLLEKKAGGSW